MRLLKGIATGVATGALVLGAAGSALASGGGEASAAFNKDSAQPGQTVKLNVTPPRGAENGYSVNLTKNTLLAYLGDACQAGDDDGSRDNEADFSCPSGTNSLKFKVDPDAFADAKTGKPKSVKARVNFGHRGRGHPGGPGNESDEDETGKGIVKTATLTVKPLPLTVEVVDGKIGKDRQISATVKNCVSGDLTVSSKPEAFAKTDWNDEKNLLTATLKKGLEPGDYTVTFDCAGQEPLVRDTTLTEDQLPDIDEGGNGDNGNGGGKTESPKPTHERLSFVITDGFFTAKDRGIAFKVRNCESNQVTASSPVFSSTSYNKKSHVVNAQIKRGTEDGKYKLTVTCKGQKPVNTKITISQSPLKDQGGNDNNGDNNGVNNGGGGSNDQTSVVPKGPVQTGRGAAPTSIAGAGLR